jgi:hypothetical protein
MGVFAQRQAAYTPPFDDSKPTPNVSEPVDSLTGTDGR